MPAESPAPTSPLPLFHRNVVALDATLHSKLRLDRNAGYGFAAAAHVVPLGLEEVEVAALYYPILLTGGESPIPVALVGVREGQNLFVDRSGAWMPGQYVPAYLRAFPFLFVEDIEKGVRYVAIEAEAACLSTERGQPMFDNGQPTPTLVEAISLSESLRNSLRQAAEWGKALEGVDMLDEREATIDFIGGEKARIGGFRTVDPKKFQALPNDTFLTWRHRGWLAPVYAHLLSGGNWPSFIELASNRPAVLQ
ncbi:MAG: SapC family protein [Candidatus Binatia bacterium]